jgi:cell division protein FtsA
VVVDIESTVHSIQRAIEEAELMAGCEIRSVYASISGSHTQCKNSPGIVPIREGEVSYADMERVLEAAKAVAIPSDQKILHAIPQEYIVDNSQEGIRHPVGMSGVRLEVRAHLVVGAQSAAQNIMQVRAALRPAGRRPDPGRLASSTGGADLDEKELGVVLVDIGAGTTDIAVFVQGAIRHTASLPIAGDQVTNDIAHLLRTPTPHAEEIKVRYACALAQLATAEEHPGAQRRRPAAAPAGPAGAGRGGAEPLRGNLRDGAGRTAPLRLRGAGARRLVLTGGASRMEGVVELAEEMLHMPVRIGIPQYVGGLGEVVGNPVHATGVGLLLWGSQHRAPARAPVVPGKVGSAFGRVLRNWFRGEF